MLGRAGVRRDRTRIPKVPMPAARWFGSSLNVPQDARAGRAAVHSASPVGLGWRLIINLQVDGQGVVDRVYLRMKPW